MPVDEPLDSPVESWQSLGDELGIHLLVKRDDLLPFPLAGNKVRKLTAECDAAGWTAGDVLISNGGVDSNHCRTLAFMGARLGCRVHLVLHDDDAVHDGESKSLRMLTALGASYDVGPSATIPDRLAAAKEYRQSDAGRTLVVPGGAHTVAAVAAFRAACIDVLDNHSIDVIVHASGTGATQAGLVLGAEGRGVAVHGISVARTGDRAALGVSECLQWFGKNLPVEVDTRFVDGGYGRFSTATLEAVSSGWSAGLPLDPVYTGKAFRGLKEQVGEGHVPADTRVLFWHTGGLMNQLVAW